MMMAIPAPVSPFALGSVCGGPIIVIVGIDLPTPR